MVQELIADFLELAWDYPVITFGIILFLTFGAGQVFPSGSTNTRDPFPEGVDGDGF